MNCFYEALQGCCLTRNAYGRTGHTYSTNGRSVALLIEGFPRPRLNILVEFSDLLYLLRQHDANCTFFISWEDVKRRGMTPIVRELIRAINMGGHEVALHFKRDFCTRSTTQLCQDAVEALHYVQRVFGTTVNIAKISYAFPDAASALESLGLTVIGDCSGPRIVSFADDALLLEKVQGTLDILSESGRRCVRLDALLDEI